MSPSGTGSSNPLRYQPVTANRYKTAPRGITGERMYEAELRRVKGELSLMQEVADLAAVEHCFRTAVERGRGD